MKVLVVGGGGREHALSWGISNSEGVQVICAPGNGGTAKEFTNVNIGAEDIDSLVRFAAEEKIDLTVVGPEAPLMKGISNRFLKEGLPIVGPVQECAMLEGSKSFAKEIMKEAGIPTADYKVFSSPDEAIDFVKRSGKPWVVKADGLAAGKGVTVPETVEEAISAIERVMVKKEFGTAGDKVVLEEKLEGYECSAIALFDGKDFLFFDLSQDHKRAFDGDMGPNTGGMGAYSPLPFISTELKEKIIKKVFEPLSDALQRRNLVYRGFVYAGLMISDGEPYVLEFNVRMGDPEAQPLIMRLETGLLDLLINTWDGRLYTTKIEFKPESATCVVMASKGYPGKYEKNKEIKGIEEAEKMENVKVFHAGTVYQSGKFYTSGGRVLGVTALGKTLKASAELAYSAVHKISWDGVHFRRDIAHQGTNYQGEG